MHMKKLSADAQKIKIILAVLFITAILLAVVTAFSDKKVAYAQSSEFGGGNGTESSPYLITTDLHLQKLAVDVQSGGVNGYEGVYFRLENDIDLTEISQGALSGWLPIGNSLYPFSGTFLGNNKKITGMIISRISDNVGLFGVTDTKSVIKDLSVDGNLRGGMFTGGIAGYNSGLIENCVNLAKITTMSASATDTGGIVGHNFKGTVRGSINYGEISNSTFNVGGIAGVNDGVLSQCFNVGTLQGGSNAGGIAGSNSRDGVIEQSFNDGGIAVQANYAGGIAGDNKGRILNTYNGGALKSSSSAADYFGGIAGNNDGSNGSAGSVIRSYNVGEVEGVPFAGNICAFNTGSVDSCYYNADINDADAVNGIYAVNTFGLAVKAMLDSDTLSDGKKMNLLNADGVWQRRDCNDDYVFFPELASLYNRSESEYSVRFLRVPLAYDDVTLCDSQFVYNGQTHKKSVSVDGVILSENLDYDIVSDCVNADGVNQSSVTVSFKDYYKGTVSKEFTIVKSPITAVWSDEVFYYNGRVQHHTLTVDSGRVGNENITFTYLYDANINAGTHTVTAVLADTDINANYSFESVSQTYEILKKPLSVVWSDEEFIYNGNIQFHSLLFKDGVIGNEIVEPEYSFYDCINAKEHTVTATLKDNAVNSNYSLEKQVHTFEIKPKPLTVVWSDAILIYNGLPQHPSASVNGVVNDESVVLSYSHYDGNVDVGEDYCVALSLADNAVNLNYRLDGVINHKYAITPSEITVCWDNAALSYNAKPQYPSFRIADGLVNNQQIEFDISDYSQNIYCGYDYSVTVSLSQNQVNRNYFFNPVTKVYRVEKAKLLLSWEADILRYNGQLQHPVAEIVSPVFDSVSLVYSDYNGLNAGNGYTVAVAPDNANYEVVGVFTYDIKPAILHCEWNSGDLTYNGLCQRPTYVLSGLYFGDTVSEILSDYDGNIRVGEYRISVASTNPNYILDNSKDCVYRIVRRNINILDVEAISRVYDESRVVELAEGRLDGLLARDTVSFLLGQGMMENPDAGIGKTVKTQIELSGPDADNYCLVQPELSVDISRAVIDMSGIAFESRTFAFDGKPKSVFIEGDLHKSLKVSYKNNSISEIGEHRVVAEFVSDNKNYHPVSALYATLFIVRSHYVFNNVSVNISDGFIKYGAEFKIGDILQEDTDIDIEGFTFQKGIYLDLLSDNLSINPDGVLRIAVALPSEALKASSICLYRLTEDGIMPVDYSIEDGLFVFYTDSTGSFFIFSQNSYVWIAAVLLPVFALTALLFLLISVRKKQAFIASQNNLAKQNPERSDTVFNLTETDLTLESETSGGCHIDEKTDFTFDDVYCKNYECFMRSLSFRNARKQKDICAGNLELAKLYEAKSDNVIFWKGNKIKVNSKAYFKLMQDAKAVI